MTWPRPPRCCRRGRVPAGRIPNIPVMRCFRCWLYCCQTERLGRSATHSCRNSRRRVAIRWRPSPTPKPKLSTCSITRLIQHLRPSITLADADCDVAINAMRIPAEQRAEGILGNSRRRHYGHVALLVASCVASASAGREREFAKWVADVRQQYWRRHAFREELTRAFVSLGLAPPSSSAARGAADGNTPRHSRLGDKDWYTD